MGMTLRRLAADLGCRTTGADVRVSGVALDSRCVDRGDVFAALPGTHLDGRQFIDDAIQRGAVALLVAEGDEVAAPLPCIVSASARADAARAAHVLEGHPGSELEIVGVTGTNGKTTTTWLLQHLLSSEVERFGCLGTVSFRAGAGARASTHTTPDPVSLARLLAEMREAGLAGTALEVSSHALAQDRVAGLRFAGVAFTNLTRDHLDYHGSLSDYLSAKLMMLDHLCDDAPVVFPSADLAFAPAIVGRPGALGFGRDAAADVRILDESHRPDGSTFGLATPWGHLALSSPLLGPFNASNVAAAVALGLALGRQPDVLATRLATFAGIPGRMQRITRPGAPLVVVDYAHTPDAVAKALDACRSACSGRLLAVVGAGGDRDRGKRPLMGGAAQRHADVVVLTSDNPRSEDPDRILDDMAAGIEPDKGPVLREVDRAVAIRTAIEQGRPGDCVAILGKGHEDYQEVGGVRRPFSDADIASAVLAEAARG
ncbi:MAG: UDP-N-acetylmuramoyl-L-alanyl-D-glutamate--2,6-diaminopimelate ligase [Planctomycetota bacterium]|nr:UDP-N-acetylmuramoyl-L-alanyl-D-glutamate--2,6-diaminopimelate ligase [Planctomycetota bacterium]